MSAHAGMHARRGRGTPWRAWPLALLGLALLLLAPALAWAQGADSLTLSWTAPGDDGNVGTAAAYELRMATTAIDAGNFDGATVVGGVPAPRVAGTRQSVTVRSLTRGTTYWFAIKSRDESGNWSTISNVVRWDWTIDLAPPAAPAGIAAALLGADVRVTWNPNSEPDLAGYRVYRASAATGPWTLVSGGTVAATEFTDTAPPPGATTLWYAVSALDVSANESARSAAAQVVLDSGAPLAWDLDTGYPNPSRIGTPVNIPVVVPSAGAAGAVLEIVDAASHTVRRIDLGALAPGARNVTWDGRNEAGRDVAPGAYTAWLLVGGARLHTRLVRVP
jgi:chitodextrinase